MFSENSKPLLTPSVSEYHSILRWKEYWSLLVSISQKHWANLDLSKKSFLTLPVAFMRNHCIYGTYRGQL